MREGGLDGGGEGEGMRVWNGMGLVVWREVGEGKVKGGEDVMLYGIAPGRFLDIWRILGLILLIFVLGFVSDDWSKFPALG